MKAYMELGIRGKGVTDVPHFVVGVPVTGTSLIPESVNPPVNVIEGVLGGMDIEGLPVTGPVLEEDV